MARRREDPVCEHFQLAAELIGKRWNLQILRALLAGNTRYTDLRDAVPGLSDQILSQRLKELEAASIIERTVTATTPVCITYALTRRGNELRAALEELARWAERWAATTVRRR